MKPTVYHTGFRRACQLAAMAMVVGLLLAAGWQVARGALIPWGGIVIPNISQSTSVSRPAIAISDNGQMWAIWPDRRSGTTASVYYARGGTSGLSWNTPVRVAPSTADAYVPTLDLSGDTAWLAWAEGFESTLYQATIAGGNTTIITVPTDHRRNAAWSVIDRAGDWLYMAFNGAAAAPDVSDILLSWRPLAATSWPTATVVYTGTLLSGAQYPDMIVDDHGVTQTLHLVWQDRTAITRTAVLYQSGVLSGGVIDWSPVVTLSTAITEAILPAIALASDGDVHVAWGEIRSTVGRGLYHTHWNGTSWSPAVSIVEATIIVNTTSPTYVEPALATTLSGSADTVCLAWTGCWTTDCIEEIWVSCSTDDGQNWYAPANVSKTPGGYSHFPDVAFDALGNLHVVWQEKGFMEEGYSVYFARSLPYSIYLPLVSRAN